MLTVRAIWLTDHRRSSARGRRQGWDFLLAVPLLILGDSHYIGLVFAGEVGQAACWRSAPVAVSRTVRLRRVDVEALTVGEAAVGASLVEEVLEVLAAHQDLSC